MGLLLGEILPLAEIERLEGAVGAVVEHNLGTPLEEEREGPFGRANVYRLPEAV